MATKARPRVLIATIPGDLHAFSIAEILRIKGAEPVLWFTSDFPTQDGESISFDNGAMSTSLGQADGWPFHSIWTRRAHFELPAGTLTRSDYAFAEVQCRRLRQAVQGEFLSSEHTVSGLCVNPYRAAVAAENKLTQYFAAQKVGLTVPQSLFSNDPSRIREFLDGNGGRLAFKPIRSILWVEGEKELLNFTRVIRAEDLPDNDLLQLSPAIYQEVVPKRYELRVTMMGKRAFAVKVNSQETDHGRVDWRRAYGELTMEPWELPSKLEATCWELLRSLGLCFGCFDFIVTPDGRYVFLEVNQGGQFLFVEEYSGVPLADAFAELLFQGTPEFEWSETAETVRFKAVLKRASAQAASSFNEHVASEPPKIVEGADLRPIERKQALL